MKKNKKNINITRKEAIKKLGTYAALTAVGTFAILNPLRAQTTSSPINTGGHTPPPDGRTAPEGESSEFTNSTQVKNNF